MLAIQASKTPKTVRAHGSRRRSASMLRLLRIMAPVLQASRALALGVLLRFPFLGQMSLTIRHHLPHVCDVLLLVCVGVLVWVLLEDLDDLAAAAQYDTLSEGRTFIKGWSGEKSMRAFRGQWSPRSHRLCSIRKIGRILLGAMLRALGESC